MRRFVPLIVTIGVFGALALGWQNRYDIHDWYRLRDYTPSAEIVQLADETSMTEYGRRLFYVNHPELNDKSSFSQKCKFDEQTIVLGCYASGRGIYLYRVTDERLNGIHQVTAAHEMLHAAYERLSQSTRERIDRLTNQAFLELQDERVRQAVEAYRARDPSIVPNELHSILATEVESLPAELEEHYSLYFMDRQAVVRLAKQYESAFAERKAKIAAYDAQMADLQVRIEALERDLASQESRLRSDRARLDALLAANRNAEYNAAVADYNARVRSYNADVAAIRKLIEQHNAIVLARNAIAMEENELVEAIDSRPDTILTE